MPLAGWLERFYKFGGWGGGGGCPLKYWESGPWKVGCSYVPLWVLPSCLYTAAGLDPLKGPPSNEFRTDMEVGPHLLASISHIPASPQFQTPDCEHTKITLGTAHTPSKQPLPCLPLKPPTRQPLTVPWAIALRPSKLHRRQEGHMPHSYSLTSQRYYPRKKASWALYGSFRKTLSKIDQNIFGKTALWQRI